MPLLVIDAGIKFIGGQNRRAKLKAWGWLITHAVVISKKRKALQAKRRAGDEKILSLFSGTYIQAAKAHPLNIFFRALARLLGFRFGV